MLLAILRELVEAPLTSEGLRNYLPLIEFR